MLRFGGLPSGFLSPHIVLMLHAYREKCVRACVLFVLLLCFVLGGVCLCVVRQLAKSGLVCQHQGETRPLFEADRLGSGSFEQTYNILVPNGLHNCLLHAILSHSDLHGFVAFALTKTVHCCTKWSKTLLRRESWGQLEHINFISATCGCMCVRAFAPAPQIYIRYTEYGFSHL